MDTSELKTAAKNSAAPTAKPKRTSRVSKAFWGLIGLMAVIAGGLITMAVVSLNRYTYEETAVTKPKAPDVEIISLGGNARVVGGGTAPANPVNADESVVDSGTQSTAGALGTEKQAGSALVAQVAVKPVTPVKKQVATAEAKNPAEQPVKAKSAEAPKREKAETARIQKEANKQMDNLF